MTNPETLARRRFKPVNRILERREQIARKAIVANEETAALRDKLAQAAQADRAAHAQALATGKTIDSNEEETVRAQLNQAERRAADLAAAAQVVERELVELRAAHRDAWTQAQTDAVAQAEQNLQEAQARLTDERALLTWVGERVESAPVFSEQELAGFAAIAAARSEAEARRSSMQATVRAAEHAKRLARINRLVRGGR